MLDEAIRLMDGIDCIIACAGFGYYERFNCHDYEHIERIFQTNVFSTLYTLERFLVKTTGKVSFVAISSVLGKFGLPGMALYSATKHALDGFQDSYRYEKLNRLHYMTVYPIGLRTNFWERIATDIPLPRPLQSADKAAVAILKGINAERRVVYTSLLSRFALFANQVIPVFIPIYQRVNKQRFVKWLKKYNKPVSLDLQYVIHNSLGESERV
jgi:short-subunit dehydrogenase